MTHPSYWIESASLPRFPHITEDVEVDVAVIGGGMTGITAAYLLKKAGKTVALLERGRCASVDTGHTTAHLTAVTDLRFTEIEKRFGKDAVKGVWDAGAAAIDQIVTLIRAEGIECDFKWVPGYLHASADSNNDDSEAFSSDLKLAQASDISATFQAAIPLFKRPGLLFPHQAIFHPRKYLAALVSTLPGSGSYVFEDADAAEIEKEPLAIKVGEHRVKCAKVIMATHNPLMGIASTWGAALFQTKLSLYTSYALSAKIRAGAAPEACFWDTKDPYDYLRVEKRRGFDLAIFGGEDHKTGQEQNPQGAYDRLQKRFLHYFPDAEITQSWSGQVIETSDGLPYIGELTDNQYGATGYAGNGMTFGTLGGMMAADYVLGKNNPWTELFHPSRKAFHGGAWQFLKENKDYPFYMLRDWLAKSDGDSVKDLLRGEGKILSLKGKRVAAFRDDHGKVSLCSPVCTHLKCIVGWNDAEKTWDCPCHGSRFKPTGEIISGPAEEPLESIADEG